MKSSLLSLSLCLLSSYFGLSQNTYNESFLHNGLIRDYRIYVPAIYDGSSPVPLLFNLHGYTSDNISQEFYADFRPIADTAGFIIVHPNGTFDQNGDRWWNAFDVPGIDDVGFLSDLIDSMSTNFNIDLNRIYSTGMSNGGFMSYELACSLGNRITAIASVTGTMLNSKLGSCSPIKATPVMQIHGTNDPTVPYAGDTQFAPIESVVNFWVQENGCNLNPTINAVPDINLTDGCTAEHYIYSNGNNGTSVEFYKIIGGAHTWPGSPFVIGVTNQDFNACKEIWRFFQQYSLDELLSLDSATKVEYEVAIFPNPSESEFLLNSDYHWDELIVFDITGRIIERTSKYLPQYSIRDLKSGEYHVQIKFESNIIFKKIIKI